MAHVNPPQIPPPLLPAPFCKPAEYALRGLRSRTGCGLFSFALKNCAAFTLIELLVVVAVMALMLGLAAPLFRTDKSPSVAVYGVSGTFEQARAYALANNTYVFVGLFEEDGSSSPTAAGAIAASGTGRVVIAVVASKDGTCSVGNLCALSKLQRFEGVSIASARLTDTLGGMTRPPVDANGVLVSGTNVSTMKFAWPIGKTFGSGQYNFQNVICFDPRGSARFIDANHSVSSIPSYIEIGLQPAHGNVVAGNKDIAAVQIDAMNGATRIYRP